MITTLLWEIKQRRAAIMWWTIGSVVISVGILALYPAIRDQANQFNDLFNKLPAGLRQLKTGGAAHINVADPVAFLNSQLFYITLPILWIILAINRAGSLMRRDEEDNTIELLLARPISRGHLLVAKAADLLVEFLIIGGVTLLAITLLAPVFGLHIATSRLAIATAYTILFSLSFGYISFALQAASNLTRRVAGVLAVLGSFGGYLIASLSALTNWLEVPAKFAPYHYFAPDKVMLGMGVRGLNLYLAGSFIVMSAVAYLGFRRRDIG